MPPQPCGAKAQSSPTSVHYNTKHHIRDVATQPSYVTDQVSDIHYFLYTINKLNPLNVINVYTQSAKKTKPETTDSNK